MEGTIKMDVVLVHPEIPWNTGNVARTCVATNTPLHLIKPLGFSLDDKQMKRAGLDYWPHLDLTVHESVAAFYESELNHRPMFLFSRFAKRSFWQAEMSSNAVLVFGSETKGLPEDFKHKHPNGLYRIPTPGKVRSLNLSTSVAIALFEGLRP